MLFAVLHLVWFGSNDKSGWIVVISAENYIRRRYMSRVQTIPMDRALGSWHLANITKRLRIDIGLLNTHTLKLYGLFNFFNAGTLSHSASMWEWRKRPPLQKSTNSINKQYRWCQQICATHFSRLENENGLEWLRLFFLVDGMCCRYF